MALRQASQALRRCISATGARAAASGAIAAPVLGARGFASDAELLKTPLYDYHLSQGAKMGPFAGYSMPLQYKDSVMDNTTAVRTEAGIFDVSHMCGLRLTGKNVLDFMETLVVGDLKGLAPGTSTLSVITNERGGIIDDTVITKVAEDHLYVVLNAGCREKDLAHINKHLEAFNATGGGVAAHVYDERGLIALQGPAAAAALQALVGGFDLNTMLFGHFRELEVAGMECFVTRTGYTGEDGFEISMPAARIVELTEALMAQPRVRLAGLAARDALRLEAGLCLYGNDLTEDITPVEAGLTWTVGKRRREEGGFLGAAVILDQINNKSHTKRRVGILPSGAPARGHSPILSTEGEVIGEITSGAFSPYLKKNIAMGYVNKAFGKADTEVLVEVRGKRNPAVVAKMPFVPTKYFKGV